MSLAEAVKVRRSLLAAELRTAIAAGRTADVPFIRAEWRGLDVDPVAAFGRRLGRGRVVAYDPPRGSKRCPVADVFARVMTDSAARMSDLTAELSRCGKPAAVRGGKPSPPARSTAADVPRVEDMDDDEFCEWLDDNA